MSGVHREFKFNINNHVKVRITKHGEKLRRKHYTDLGVEVPNLSVDDDGYSTWQLWYLMSIFGEHMCNGCDIPFYSEIKFNIPLWENVKII